MNWSTSVVSSTSTDTDPTVLITFENARYIFNVGENTSRTFLQSRNISWRKARAVFLSQICAERSAGLPGFLMTLSDSGLKDITIGGPDGLNHFIASLRLYTRREDMSVSTIEHPQVSEPDATPHAEATPMYKDENITVFAVQAIPKKAESSNSSLKRKRSGEQVSTRKQSRSSSPTASAPSASIRPSSSSNPKASTSAQEQPKIAFSGLISLIKRMRDPSFTPQQLSATDASAWRKLTIEHMFGAMAQGRHENVSPAVEAGAEAGVVVTKEEQASASNGTEAKQPVIQNRPKRIPSPANSDKRLPYWKSGLGYDQRAACSYIIHGPKVRGKFDANRAAALGLKPGPLRGKVAKGETVEIKVKLPDGTEVTRKIGPDDCLCSPETPLVLCVVDCPAVGYIDSLVSSPTWKAYHPAANEGIPHQVHLIYHLAGDGVLEDERYKTWMKKFGDHVHHLVANRSYCPDKATFTSVSMSQLRLHNLDKDMFPLPHFTSESVKNLEDVNGLPAHTQIMDKNHHTGMRPLMPPEITPNESDKFHEAVKADPSDSLSPGMKTKFEEARAAVDTAQSGHSQELPGSDVAIIPFGTSSATPTKYRNVSATLVQIPGHGNVLLDCGEGTYGQLSRHFGPQTGDVLRDLRCIFISHIHADHHMGLSKLLAMRRKLKPKPTQPLYLVAFRSIHLYLLEYSDLEDLGFSEKGNGGIVRINADTIHRNWRPYDGPAKAFVDFGLPSYHNSELALPKLREALGLDDFIGVDVAHRTRCFGLVMRHKSGWSLVYSGDTMPCNNLVEAGKDATLLIHEATMSDEEAELAAKKAHSTCGQAIDIAKQMQAQNVLLTHFSARHPKMPPGISTLENLNVGITFDQMRLSLNQVWKLAMYQDAITESFSDMEEEELLRLPLNQGWRVTRYQDVITESSSDMKEEKGNVVTTS